jgi:hypothetical protein
MRKVKLAAAILLGGFTGLGAADLPILEPRVLREYVHVPVEVPAPKKTLETLLVEIPPKYGVSPLIAQAIAHQESGVRMDAIRFEPGQVNRAIKATKRTDEVSIRQYASSHCAMQVMGYHTPRYGKTWADLYDAEICLEMSMAIYRDCATRSKATSKLRQIREALTCYNGSEKYADVVISRLGRMLIEENL